MEKISLPIKTKIAAWWMIGMGAISLLPLIAFLWPKPFLGTFPTILFSAPIGLLFIVSGLLLLIRKLLGWWLAITLIFVALIISLLTLIVYEPRAPSAPAAAIILTIILFLLTIPSPLGAPSIFIFETHPQMWPIGGFFLIFIFFIPFVLLFLNRKNFWKIAS